VHLAFEVNSTPSVEFATLPWTSRRKSRSVIFCLFYVFAAYRGPYHKHNRTI